MCRSEKRPWLDYVKHFMTKNTDIPEDFYGKWIEILEKSGMGRVDTANEQTRESHTLTETTGQPTENTKADSATAQATTVIKEKEKQSTDIRTLDGGDDENDDGRPNPRDFNIPDTEEDHESLIQGMIACGMHVSDAEANIKSRKTAFNRATREYKKAKNPPILKKPLTRGRKTN